ncbi:MAG: hypothetical protein ACD_18C00291G0003 [uncultured bacterium]|nr:MAG: hypothetical protein ACD_18C00291G0003 [uncultured bacterium]
MSKNTFKVILAILFTTTLAGCSLPNNKISQEQKSAYETAYEMSQEKDTDLLYECEKQFIDEDSKQGCKDFVLKDASYTGDFYGHECSDTENCLAQQEGYEWAKENNITSEDACLAYSLEFLSGCQEAIADNTQTNTNESQKAIDLVKNLSEVKNWLKQFSNADGTSPITGGQAIIAVDSITGDFYSIHAFESLTERNVTFNWYDVNLETGDITDSLGQIVR